MQAAAPPDHGCRHCVEDNQPVGAVLDAAARDYEDRSGHCWHNDLPFPAQAADLGITAAGVDGKQGHVTQMLWQLVKQPLLLVPIERIWLPLMAVRQVA